MTTTQRAASVEVRPGGGRTGATMSNFESGPVKLTQGELRWEDAAEQVTLTGWSCKMCHRFYGDNERAARFCCHTDAPCECGKRKDRHHVSCPSCYHIEKTKRWNALEQVECGEPSSGSPWTTMDGETYFFDCDEFLEHCTEHQIKPSEAFPLLCHQYKPGTFDLSEWLEDYSSDGECPVDDNDIVEANESVNAVLARCDRWPWYTDSKRRPSDSTLKVLDGMYEQDQAGEAKETA